MLASWGKRAPVALTWVLRAVAIGAAIWALGRLFLIVPERIAYAGELEWMEGGILEHVRRVATGRPLYVAPSPEFTPFLYTPLYYWLCAGLGSIFALDVHLLRAVSFACFLGSCFTIAVWTGRRTRHFYVGALGAGIFAATFRLGGAWFDIARGDSLLVFLLLLGGLLILEFRGEKSAVAAGVALTAAFLTKQSAILPASMLVFWALATRSRRGLIFTGTTATLILSSILVLHVVSDGWFTYYVFQLPSRHEVLEDWKLLFWKHDVLGNLALPAILTAVLLVRELETSKDKARAFGLIAFSAGVVGMVWSSRFHIGMYDNVLMPLHALGGLGVALLLAQVGESNKRSLALEWAALAAVVGFIWRHEYPLEQQVPSDAQRTQYARLVQRLKELPPKTWVAYHAVPALDAGFPPRAHWMGMIDVIRGGESEAAELTKRSERWLRNHEAPAIVWSIDDPSTAWFTGPMRRYYKRSGRISGPGPLTGWGQAPREIWVPRDVPPPNPPTPEPRPAPKGSKPR